MATEGQGRQGQRGAELASGTVVAGYRITQRIGGGGMGTVYSAEQPQIGKRVAIKVLKRELLHDDDAVRRFEREARAANEVRHPGIVDVFAFGTLDGGLPYLVMSLLEGRSLAEEISAKGALSPDLAWAYARQMADALSAAHERGIAHRDLKPENVFLESVEGGPPRVRLLDLGLAKSVEPTTDPNAPDGSAMKLTKTGVPIGTPVYMAPEQWWAGEIDTRVDQYAFGITLYEMLTGAPPFRSSQFVELAQLHLHATPPALAERGCEASAPVEAFMRRLLAKSPDDRFASMNDVVSAGDAAFAATAVDVAKAPTVASGVAAAQERAPTRTTRAVAALAALAILGPTALMALGYPGHTAREWWKTTGPPAFFIAGGYLSGLGALVWYAARPRALGLPLAWACAVFTAVAAAVGTHVGWTKVDRGIAKLAAPTRFEIMHLGMLELLLSHFVGFFAAAMLFTTIGALAGSAARPGLRDEGRRDEGHLDLGVAAALALGAAIAGSMGVGSGAVVAAVAAVAVAAPHAFGRPRTLTVEQAAARAAATVLAAAAGLAVGLARVDALAANAWSARPTRAARAAEMIAVAAERRWTLVVGGMAVALVIASAVVGLRRELRGAALRGAALRGAAARGAGRRALALGGLVAAVIGADLTLRVQFARAQARLHDAVESQFALFASLEPPAVAGLEPERYRPGSAPALQIARNSVAVNARPLVPLGAIDFDEGSADVAREISRALAARTVDGHDARLSVSIDRAVSWSAAGRLLELARRAGAERVELLFTRGSAAALPEGAPPEATWVLASDFVALPIEVGAGGVEAPPEAPFEVVAEAIVARARAGEVPVRVALPAISR